MDQPQRYLICATNVTGYTLGFNIYIVGSVSPNTTISKDGQLATASFTVTSDNNGTSVRCTADNGDLLTRSTPVYAYAQGKW